MMEDDLLRSVLREWKALEPPAAMDARVKAAYRAAYGRSPWHAFWRWRVSVPAPALVLAAAIALVLFLQFRSVPAPVSPRAEGGYVTRLDATGFQPLPNGAARVVAAEGIRQ